MGGLWEHAVVPLFDMALYGDTLPCDASLLRAGNLHTDSLGRAQAEYLLCAPSPSSPPKLLAAWVNCCIASCSHKHICLVMPGTDVSRPARLNMCACTKDVGYTFEPCGSSGTFGRNSRFSYPTCRMTLALNCFTFVAGAGDECHGPWHHRARRWSWGCQAGTWQLYLPLGSAWTRSRLGGRDHRCTSRSLRRQFGARQTRSQPHVLVRASYPVLINRPSEHVSEPVAYPCRPFQRGTGRTRQQ